MRPPKYSRTRMSRLRRFLVSFQSRTLVSSGLRSVSAGWLPKPIPPLRAGYLTTRGDYALAEASRRLGVAVVGGRADGFAGKSTGAIVAQPGGARHWLKVSGLVGRARDTMREAEIESGRLPALPKPEIIATADWNEGDIFWRAVLMTLSASPAVSRLPWCPEDSVHVSDAWFVELRSALAKLRYGQTQRFSFTPDQVQQMIVEHIGPDAPVESDDWHVGHGDLHWANLTAPQCMLLDWEHWGLTPRGFDIGRLLGCSALAPDLMVKTADAFSEEFESPAGRVGLLAGIASVKGHIALGELDPAAAQALEPIIQRILRMEREGRRSLRASSRFSGHVVSQ